MKIFLLILLATGVAGAFAIGCIRYYMTTKAKPLIYSHHDIANVPERMVALVLGALVYPSGRLSNVLADRMDIGIALYQQGKVKKLLLSGDHGAKSYNEVQAMMQYALENNVPAEDIFLDHAGFRTYDSLFRAKEVFQLESLIIVTQEFHLPRAVYIGQTLGLNVTGVSSDKRSYAKIRNYQIREWFACFMAFMELHLFFHPPKYLGPKIDINGHGQQTHD